MPPSLDPASDAAWSEFAAQWRIRLDTTYLNHGSFGPPPLPVLQARETWQRQLDAQPMDFFTRQLEPAWFAARDQLAAFVGASSADLIFVENATTGMNIVAQSFPLSAGDQVLMTDHEYGAVVRIWRRACEKSAAEIKSVALPLPFHSTQETVDSIFANIHPRTRLLVVSHVTSPTAVILPVAAICGEAHRRGIAVCIDGPHAPAHVPLDIAALDCDFYTASCHKWLSAPFGSGFLQVAPRWQSSIQPALLSWGRIPPTKIETWSDEFVWCGTRDSSAFLAIPAAIHFLESVGLDNFRARIHALAQYARQQLVNFAHQQCIVPDSPAWYGGMAHVPLPPGNREKLQAALWAEYQIEAPIVEFAGSRFIRVSCHLYNTTKQIDYLASSLATLLRDE